MIPESNVHAHKNENIGIIKFDVSKQFREHASNFEKKKCNLLKSIIMFTKRAMFALREMKIIISLFALRKCK